MKWLVLLTFFSYGVAFGQSKNNDLLEKLKKKKELLGQNRVPLSNIPGQVPKIQNQATSKTYSWQNNFLNKMPGGTALKKLPLDNMPCLVPNDLGSNDLVARIPNASSAYILKYPIDPGIYVERKMRFNAITTDK